MIRLTVTLDEGELDEARKALGTRTKRETIAKALREVTRLARLRCLLEHRGRVDLGFTTQDLIRRREEP
ncbi:MAG: type II toxin-antitoxin system VapB family antitoxin [Candidatus Riflebacteria bacterium]|nr:type II toxin-antitoxin system VapB family antitoxin [Candidatus Riflebacteria bacterium]